MGELAGRFGNVLSTIGVREMDTSQHGSLSKWGREDREQGRRDENRDASRQVKAAESMH